MTTSPSLDLILDSFMKLAESQGIARKEMENGWNEQTGNVEWNLDYKASLQDMVQEEITGLLKNFELHQAAFKNGDMVTAQAGLIGAGVFAKSLSNLFGNINDECNRVLFKDQRFNWPKIPETYTIPKHYHRTD